ncbi:HEAT repeat domain-containing protein [Actinomadura sp. 3N508]|uniref:HEAT repeat domain-containing protein n=1 Tax=Actinomadura sp. 3N508 TaxID=3375153 RepID=UPI0037B03243
MKNLGQQQPPTIGRFHHTADWPALTHAYGRTAAAVPELLEQAASDDPTLAEKALHNLSGTIYHQGWVYPATEPAVAALYELVSAPATHHRPRILGLLSDIATAIWDLDEHDEAEYDDPSLATVLDWARAARSAVEAGVPALLTLLDDADPSVRAAAPFVLADFPTHAPDLVPRLQEATATEQDAGAAASMILAIGDICSDRSDRPLTWLTKRSTDPRREVRAAAAVAALWCGTGDDLLEAITEEVQAAESALDDQLWVLDGGRTALLLAAVNEHPVQHIRLTRDALTAPSTPTVHRTGEIMRTWRAAPAELLPALADLLTTDLTKEAIWEIKQGGPDIALVADALLPLLTHPDDLIAGSALEALARTGDARCIHALAADLAEPRLSFHPSAALAGMKDHTAALLTPIQEFLATPKKGTDFAGNYLISILKALPTWGDQALPLLPELITLLERRKAVPATAEALAALGPAATEAVPALRRFLGRKHGPHTSQNAAWALWQITGEAEEPLRYLQSTFHPALQDEDAERLFNLGPAAKPALPFLDLEAAPAIIHRITNDIDRTLPHLLNAVAATPTGMLALHCLAEIGPPAAAAIPPIREIAESPRVLAAGPSAERIATDRTYQATATTALARIEINRGPSSERQHS